MTSLRKLLGLPRWSRAVLCLGLLATLIAACSVLFDTGRDQCASDKDCDIFPGQPVCHAGVCMGVGPRGCYFGTPSTPDQFANQCSAADYVPFDNCTRLGLCNPNAQPPPVVTPSMPDGGGTTSPPPPPPPTLECIDSSRQVVVVGGSTAIQPFLSVVAPLLSGIQIVYQPSGSCTGVDQLFNPDSSKRVVKDIPGKPALLFSSDGKSSQPCTLSTQNGAPPVTPVALDVAASDVFASSCNASYAVTAQGPIGEYLGPIQPMTFVVKSESKEKSISAEMGHVVFGRGSTDPNSSPYLDPSLYFVRNSGSGTQQMISRAINIDAKQWWGIDRGGSSQVRDLMEAVSGTRADNAVGILSTDFADPVRQQLRILAFQAEHQLVGYYPDSTLNTRDKRNVRDGHYAIWGPEHFFAQVTGGVPNPAAAALVTRFTLSKLDPSLLDAIIKSGLVPACAMTVKRTSEMGPLAAYSPPAACGCYFEATVVGGQAPASCQPCVGPASCPSDKPACNNGYCEAQ